MSKRGEDFSCTPQLDGDWVVFHDRSVRRGGYRGQRRPGACLSWLIPAGVRCDYQRKRIEPLGQVKLAVWRCSRCGGRVARCAASVTRDLVLQRGQGEFPRQPRPHIWARELIEAAAVGTRTGPRAQFRTIQPALGICQSLCGRLSAMGIAMSHLKRREFIGLIGGAAAWPLAARGQQAAGLPRVGMLRFSKQDQAVIDSLLRGLQALGYVDGKNVAIEYRDAEGDYGRFSDAVNEVVKLNPHVIFSFGGEQAPVVKAATSTIPIVVVVSNDPVGSGLVASLARPGGNITGITYVHDMLAGKSVELLKDTAPWVSRVAILWNPRHVDPEFRETQRASRALDVQLQSLEVQAPSDFEGAFQAAVRERALIVIGSRVMFLNRQRNQGLCGDKSAYPSRRSTLVDGSWSAFDLRT